MRARSLHARLMTPRLAIGAAVLVGALVGVAARAHADVPPQARQLGDRGRALHQLGDYDGAIAAYKGAYAIAPSPALLFDLAQAYRLAGDCGDAAEYYRRFLSTGQEPVARGIAQDHLTRVDACAQRAPTVTPAVSIRAVADTGAAQGGGERRLGLVLAGSGGLALGAGLYFAIDAHGASEQVARAYATGSDWASLAPIDARGRRSSELALGFAITGGAAVATGVALYLLGRRGEHRASHAPAITIAPETRGGRVELAWAF